MRCSIDSYLIDVLMPDLVGHDRRPAAFLVYLFLQRHSRPNRRGEVAVSLQTIATRTGLSKSTVQSAIRHLKRRRLLDPDLKTTAAWIRDQKRARSSKMGIIGFCMGGSYALLLPCESKELAAAAPFYGEIPSDNKIRELSCPVFYAYDTNDGWINRSDVDRLQKALREFGKQGTVKLYPGCSHGFFNDTRPDVYNAEAARDAWHQVLQLFSANLQG